MLVTEATLQQAGQPLEIDGLVIHTDDAGFRHSCCPGKTGNGLLGTFQFRQLRAKSGFSGVYPNILHDPGFLVQSPLPQASFVAAAPMVRFSVSIHNE